MLFASPAPIRSPGTAMAPPTIRDRNGRRCGLDCAQEVLPRLRESGERRHETGSVYRDLPVGSATVTTTRCRGTNDRLWDGRLVLPIVPWRGLKENSGPTFLRVADDTDGVEGSRGLRFPARTVRSAVSQRVLCATCAYARHREEEFPFVRSASEIFAIYGLGVPLVPA